MSKLRTPPTTADLTAFEEEVINAARLGKRIERDWSVEVLTVTRDPDLCVRASVIRELLMGYHGELDPRGVRVRGIRVIGTLDLDHVVAVTGLTLMESAMPDGVTCLDAQLRQVSFEGSLLSYLHATRLRTDGNLSLHNATIRSTSEGGALQLPSAHIRGQFRADWVTIANTNGPALDADRLRTDDHMFLRNATMRGTGKQSTLRLAGAHIGGELNGASATITNADGPAVNADGLHTDANLFLFGAILRSSGTATVLRLVDAHIDGFVHLDRAVIIGVNGVAVEVDRLRVDANLFLRAAILRSASETSVLRLLGVHVGGQLHLDRTVITNTKGPAVDADRLHTGDHVFVRNATIRGNTKQSAVKLLGAHISGQLRLEWTVITNASGPAMAADRLHTGDHVFVRNATIRGNTKQSALNLLGAHISGQVHFHGSVINNTLGPLMDLNEMRVEGALFLPISIICPEGRIGEGRLGCADSNRQISLRTLVFDHLSGVSWRQWLHILVHHTPEYYPQPFQHLAAVERMAGHDNNARQVLIAQQDDLRHRASEAFGGRRARWRHQLWGWLGRYGYNAHRLVFVLVMVLALAGGVAYIAGQVPTRPGHHAAERIMPPSATSALGTPCSTAELIGLGIDRGLPLGATGLRARCDLDTATRRGQAFTYALWILQALLWGLATLAVAAYTGLVRKPV